MVGIFIGVGIALFFAVLVMVVPAGELETMLNGFVSGSASIVVFVLVIAILGTLIACFLAIRDDDLYKARICTRTMVVLVCLLGFFAIAGNVLPSII